MSDLIAIRRQGSAGPWQFVETSLAGDALRQRAEAWLGGPVDQRPVQLLFGRDPHEFDVYDHREGVSVKLWGPDWVYQRRLGGWHFWDEARIEPPGAPEVVDGLAVDIETVDAGWLPICIRAGSQAYRFVPSDSDDPSAAYMRWIESVAKGMSPCLAIDSESEFYVFEVFTRPDGLIRLHVTNVDGTEWPQRVELPLDILIPRRQLVQCVYPVFRDLQTRRKNRKFRPHWDTGRPLVPLFSQRIECYLARRIRAGEEIATTRSAE